MGMDIYGRNPKSEAGEYFRNNVWWWHPLWDYCEKIAPNITKGVLGHSNDGDGLNHRDTETLYQLLKAEIDNGNTDQYEKKYNEMLANLEDEDCTVCGGTGKRLSPPDTGPGDQDCNGCNSKGKKENFDKSYPFNVDNVIKFSNFLKDSGGFNIQ